MSFLDRLLNLKDIQTNLNEDPIEDLIDGDCEVENVYDTEDKTEE